MSEQRRLRSELKQGLHQFMMTLYNSYTQTLSHEESIVQISKCLVEEYEYFNKESMKKEAPLDLADQIRELETFAKTEKDPTEQHTIYEHVEILISAQEVLKQYDFSEGNS